jgi:hypothetical protein
VRVHKTPAGPKTGILHPQKGDPLISPEKQNYFNQELVCYYGWLNIHVQILILQ